MQTYQHHTDYVTCLVAVPQHNALVSAGLRSEVFWYDLEVGSRGAPHSPAVAHPFPVFVPPPQSPFPVSPPPSPAGETWFGN